MKLLKNILVKIVIIIMVCVVSFNLYNFICLKVLKEDLATVNGYALLEVISGSMEPTIHVGDMIIIDTKVDDYQDNDIITFYDERGSLVTHRIIDINRNDKTVITKGDNNDSNDNEFTTDNIVGRVTKIIPKAGIILESLKNPIVMVVILIIGILFCILSSTDDDLVPLDITEEEKEFLEYRKNKLEKAKAKNSNIVDYAGKNAKKTIEEPVNIQKEVVEEKTAPKKTTRKTGTKKSTTTKKITTTKKTTSKKTTKAEPKKAVKKTTTKKVEPKKVTKKNDDKTIKETTKKTKKSTKKIN